MSFDPLNCSRKKFIHLRDNVQGVLEKLASGMCPTRSVQDLWAPDLIVCRVAIALEDAFKVA
jgi:hypothetical protein